MNCYAKTYCKKFGTEACNDLCDFYVVLNALYSQSNIPRRYQFDKPLKPDTSDYQSFTALRDYQLDIVNHVNDGDNLLITSSGTGNGKTTWACKIAGYYFRKIVTTTKIENEVFYLNVSLFMEQMRNNFDAKEQGFEQIKRQAMNCRLLILDDIGVERPSDWVLERLYDLINHRYTEMKSTIYTSNLSLDELELRVGQRIASRLSDSTIITLKGTDRRKMEA